MWDLVTIKSHKLCYAIVMNRQDRKRLRAQKVPEQCPECEHTHSALLLWMERMKESNAILEQKLNQERLANAQLRATLKDLTGK